MKCKGVIGMYTELKTLTWALVFAICVAYFLIAIIESVFDTWNSNKILKANNAKLQRQLKEEQEKQEFLDSIKY